MPHWQTPASTPTWLFIRADHRITIRKTADTTLMISGGADEERFEFKTVAELVGFQAGFEAHLLESGWSLVSFSSHTPRALNRRLLAWLARRRKR